MEEGKNEEEGGLRQTLLAPLRFGLISPTPTNAPIGLPGFSSSSFLPGSPPSCPCPQTISFHPSPHAATAKEENGAKEEVGPAPTAAAAAM
jgi:hypothetical protein